MPSSRRSPFATLALGLVLATLLRLFQEVREALGASHEANPLPGQDVPRSRSPSATVRSDRGRAADSPEEVPAKGWRDIAWRIYEEFGRDRLMAVSAGVTFYLLLATFPAIGALVSLYGLVSDPASINDDFAALSGVLPSGAIDIVSEVVRRITAKRDGALGLAALLGFGVALWSANAGMKAVFDALNVVYEEEEKRGFLRLNLLSLAMTFGTIVAFALALGAVAAVPVLLKAIWLGPTVEWAIWAGRWPLLLLLAIFGLAVLYRFGPSRNGAKWRWLTPGAVLASIGVIVFSMAFSWYVANFGSYDETYGSLGAAIGFMTWIWFSIVIILLGAELNAETEHQTAKDTTVGPPAPMGTRGAEMADTLGRSR